MTAPRIRTTSRVIPMLYAYSTPNDSSHVGWSKIGYTEKQEVETRIDQQTHTSDTSWKLLWKASAIYDDGSGESFTDREFHAYLVKRGYERKPNAEWFKIDGSTSRFELFEFKSNRGEIGSSGSSVPYELRAEQEEFVAETLNYFRERDSAEVLWNAKPRFGKTLASYELCRRLRDAAPDRPFNALIVTNRPAIANSWREDYVKFLGEESGLLFVSETESLKGKPGVRSRFVANGDHIAFVSLQDLKGSVYFGGEINKLKELKERTWDVLIVDEAHEGVDTLKTDAAFDRLNRRFTLHLSGTPFKALANEKFERTAIFNWTYAMEQRAKRDWDETRGANPYAPLPRLNLFTYQISEAIQGVLEEGIEIAGKTEEYAFDLNVFFETDVKGKFKYEEAVDAFLDSLTRSEKYPFSTPELRDELKHTLWLLNRVDSAKALAQKLQAHPVFKDYEIVLAAGDGKLDADDANAKSYDKVRQAIDSHEKTITLSVGQLTTGVTVPEWTAALMLCNLKSPALYMQAAFRAQNPWKYSRDGEYFVKENAYVFDFDPARTLEIFEQFANDLDDATAFGRGDVDARKRNVRELLNFFPVVGEDEKGEMIELDAEKVLSIPRKIRSQEVVRRGFMSNFLFQNIGSIFSAPQEIVDVIRKFEPVKEPEPVDFSQEARDEFSVDETGEVQLDDAFVIGRSRELFGAKIYERIDEDLERQIEEATQNPEKEIVKKLNETFKASVVDLIVDVAKEKYGVELKAQDEKKIRKRLEEKTNRLVAKETSALRIEESEIEVELQEALKNLDEIGKTTEEVEREFKSRAQEARDKFKERVAQRLQETLPELEQEVVRTIETAIQEREKEPIENAIRDHLRGFARSIPSFLMAYGDASVTLATFDRIVPDDVFKEITNVTLDEFRLLRDGGTFRDAASGEEKIFRGGLFDEVVFNDSVQEFLALRARLADYFDESREKNIFDYIPPQRNNQIYTPKRVVKQTVDLLEAENPGCFDDPNATFADLYMKSGLYVAEIVKRLYNSPNQKALFPESEARLRHIFEKQVYGLAPTEIIYRIALNFILGFDENQDKFKHNFRKCDAAPFVKNGTLERKLDELFGTSASARRL